MSTHTKTLKVRIKDKHAKELARQARAVNFVWNYYNDLSSRSIRDHGAFLSAYDMQKYTAGSSKELGIPSNTIQQIAVEYATRRKQFKKSKLRWRSSFGARRSLGWIPFKTGAVKWDAGQFKYLGKHYGVWDSYGLAKYKFRSGNIVEDARGRWYLCIVVDADKRTSTGTGSIGIDLGCKAAATMSDGSTIDGRWYREMEEDLAIAQRANNKARVKAIHAKIANRRNDVMHKASTKLVEENAAIFVGDVNAKAIAKTKMSKSSLDAGWGIFKTMLRYKSEHAGIVFEEVNEAYTTQTCSNCGCLPDSRPKGIAGLGIREWNCSDCGVSHGRDVNAAKNILAAGHCRLAVGIPAL